MEAKYNWLNSLLNKNKSDFAQWPDIQWANFYIANDYQNKREDLLKEIGNSLLFKGTKPYYNHISKGCEICGSGKWSCLFITNKCNANCFYCPTTQLNDEKPSTQGLDFDNPDDYADYINNFQFDGVSFSGGEPLLFFERTLEYIKTLRIKCKSDLYIWMYTNGILADETKLKALADENLNEIRFDIGATGFSLDKVKLAKGIIPNITIEIPSIPEEKDRIIAMLPQMIEAGVTNLNLHHLRLTKHNVYKLVKRGYTIISEERPLVMESELAALEIISKAKELGLNIGINYCSFHFKNRFQKAGYRNVVAKKVFPDSSVTENGYIREYRGSSICYYTVKLFSNSEQLSNLSTVNIDGKIYTFSIAKVFDQLNLAIEDKKRIDELLENEPDIPPADDLLFKIWQLEYIEKGLRSV